jgi:tetratricopeptide (TPR) repeat protein
VKSERRRSPHAGVIALAVLMSAMAQRSPLAQVAVTPAPPPSLRIERLEQWLQAVERHQPGELDDHVKEISEWGAESLRLIWVDTTSLVSLVREPDISVFYISEPMSPNRSRERLAPPGSPGSQLPQPFNRSKPVVYSIGELRRLKALARTLVTNGGAGVENRVLKRGAMLHADIAMWVPVTARRKGVSGADGMQGSTLYVKDGQPVRFEEEVSHYEMGRRLLDKVRAEGRTFPNTIVADPRGDVTVCRWYLATSAHMQGTMWLDVRHLDRALELCSEDPEVQFFAGALHETLAGVRRQVAIKNARLPRDVTLSVQSAAAELRRAEGLYRRTLEINPKMSEARIRLGRVLGQRGRHEEAATELRQAGSEVAEPVLQYYAALFLAAEADALGNEVEARASYERAAALYPQAQSPLLGLSRLAMQSGNRDAARDVIQRMLKLSSDGDEAADPWWSYESIPARNTEMLLAKLHQTF